MTLLHLVRHASYDVQGVLVGRSPVPIGARGEMEASALAEALSGCGLHAVISSPQIRARQTATVIGARCGLACSLDAGLDEIDFGEWAGRRFDDLLADPRWRAFNALRSMAPTPAGETMLAVQARALAAVWHACAAHPDGAVGLVSHADVLKAVLAYMLGMPLDHMQRIELAPGSRSVVALEAGSVLVRAINLPAVGG